MRAVTRTEEEAGHRTGPGSLRPMPSAEQITDVVNRYISLVDGGTADEITDLYADDATVEDPVGGEVHIGRQAIHGFYSAMEAVQRQCELVTLRVAGHEAAFHFKLTITAGDSKVLIEPIDVMAFDGDGKIAAMKAYWSPDSVTQL
jgi:steroid delta-isomerase